MRNPTVRSRFMSLIALLAIFTVQLIGAQTPPAATLPMADIEEMLGPIALYPDSLLANVLAASVYPDEIVAANTFIKGGGAADGIDKQPWEPPVKSIAKAPEVLDFLVDNIEWTTAIGEVYIAQSQDLMAAVQTLRGKAKANGALQSSEQMTVVQSGSTIVIEPAQPQVVYVPQYNPQVVYVDDDDDLDGAIVGGMIGFGAGLLVGAAINDDWDCDWHGGCVGWGSSGWGHSDVDIDRDVNIETGDINIGSGNTMQGGDRTNNSQGGDRTNVQGGDRTTNSVGREGQKWEPNQQKVQERQTKTGGQRASDQFRGASNPTSANRSKVPAKTSASTTRQPAKPLSAGNAKPSVKPAASGAQGSRTSTRESPKPATKAPPSRPAPAPKTSAPKSRPPTPKSAPKATPSTSKPSGFSPKSGSTKSSTRGSSSRGGGGGGGGSRGGGGRGR